MIVTAGDCLKCGFCPPGIKRWCDSHGINTLEFLKHGLDSQEVIRIGDAFGLRALAKAERRTAGE